MTRLTYTITPHLDLDNGEFAMSTSMTDDLGLARNRVQLDVIRTKDKMTFMGLTAMGWLPPDGLHEVVFAEGDAQRNAARYVADMRTLRDVMQRVGPDAVHAVLAELGWSPI
jgi:hypothetical protein